MLNREIFLIANSGEAKLGEFLIELNFDQPGILATLSNIFAEYDVNIINIAIDGNRQFLHFIVDLTLVNEEQIKEITKQLGMFAFVKRVKHRVPNTSVFVPRLLRHVVNGKPAISIEKDLIAYITNPDRLAEELAKNDAKVVKELTHVIDVVTVEEVLYISQLRGLLSVENTAINNGKLTARLCNPAQPLARKYLEVFIAELGIQGKIETEGSCLLLKT